MLARGESRMMTITFEGGPALQRKLLELEKKVKSKFALQALGAGAKVIRASIEPVVPILARPDPRRRPGTLRRAIAQRTAKAPGIDYGVAVGVALLPGKESQSFVRVQRVLKNRKVRTTANPNDPFYWYFVHQGGFRRNGSRITGRPFLTQGFRAGQVRAASRVIDVLRDQIERA